MKKLLLLVFFTSLPLFAQFISEWDKVPEAIRNTNNYKRFEWFYRSRIDEQGIYPKEFIKQQLYSEEMKIKRLDASVSDLWTSLGPVGIDMSSSFVPYWGSNSGRIRGLDIHPTNPNIVYIGASAGGIWKTTNGGAQWIDKSAGLNRLSFGAIAIDPGNPSIIYAGTGESKWLNNMTSFEGDGLYKSTTGGDDWIQLTGIGAQTQFSDIQVSPLNSNIILAAVAGGHWTLGMPTNLGIWRSSDAGITWLRVLGVDCAFDVSFHPTNGSLAYCSIGNQNSAGGFFISSDAGVTWMQRNTGLPDPTSIGRMQFDLSVSQPNIIYSVIYNNTLLNGGYNSAAFKSTNGGFDWFQISTGIMISGSYYGSPSDQGSYDLCLAVNPSDPNNVFFGNVELAKTSDGSTIDFIRNPNGYTSGTGAWDGYTHTDIHKIMFASSNPSVIYIGCDGGIYKSTDEGNTFSHVNNGINTIQFYRVASHPTNSNILFGGAQDNGNFSTDNRGSTQWEFETSGDGMECFVDYNNPSNVYMSTQYGSLNRSDDGGNYWYNIMSSGGSSSTAWTTPFWQHPLQPSKIYAAVDKQISRTTNFGDTWTAISPLFDNIITCVAQSRVNTNNMINVMSRYTTSPTVYRSSNEGVSWTSITSNIVSSGFSDALIQRVTADPSDANTFYIARACYNIGQVIKTTDFGNTWTDISSNLPKVSVNDIFIDPAETNHLYAANDFGVYWSSNAGNSWMKLSNGMPFVPVMDFDFFDSDNHRYLRAASHGRGVFELNIDTPLPVELLTFSADIRNDVVYLNWTTATELNNKGFEVQRSVNHGDYSTIGFVKGNGSSISPKEYSFKDKYADGLLSYRLKQVDYNGNYTYSKPIETFVATNFAVYQNYPNPFNPSTLIKFKVPETCNTSIKIINSLGEEIETLVNEQKLPGIYEYSWNADKYSSGVYFYTVNMNSISGSKVFNKTFKMILAK